MQTTEPRPGRTQRTGRTARRWLELAAVGTVVGSLFTGGSGDALAAGRMRGARASGPTAATVAPRHTAAAIATSSSNGQPEGQIAGPMDSIACPNGGASGAISVLGIQVLVSPDTRFEDIASCDALAALTTPVVVELKVQGTLGSFVASEVQLEDANDDGTPDSADSSKPQDDDAASQAAAPATTQP